MAIGILKNARLYVGALDLSGIANQVACPCSAAEQDTTPLNTPGPKTRIPTLLEFDLTANSWQEYGLNLSDQVLFANVGGADVPFSVWGPNAAEGERVWFAKAPQLSYKPGAKVGELIANAINAKGWPLVRGNALAAGVKTANGNGTAFQLGAVTATQSVYGILHVTAFSGFTSITVKVQSDSAAGFSSPTDVITFTAATGLTSQYAVPVAGANADTYWRALWTVVGSGSATIAVSMGIQ